MGCVRCFCGGCRSLELTIDMLALVIWSVFCLIMREKSKFSKDLIMRVLNLNLTFRSEFQNLSLRSRFLTCYGHVILHISGLVTPLKHIIEGDLTCVSHSDQGFLPTNCLFRCLFCAQRCAGAVFFMHMWLGGFQ